MAGITYMGGTVFDADNHSEWFGSRDKAVEYALRNWYDFMIFNDTIYAIGIVRVGVRSDIR